MLTSNLTLDPSNAAAPAGETSAAVPAGLVADGGERFAQELAQAQAGLPAGQNLAAGALPLQTLALGPALELITAHSDQPDGDSLAAFAKAQGLDDDVVAWLFSDATQAQVQAQAMVAIPVPPGVMALPGIAAGDPSATPALPPTTLALLSGSTAHAGPALLPAALLPGALGGQMPGAGLAGPAGAAPGLASSLTAATTGAGAASLAAAVNAPGTPTPGLPAGDGAAAALLASAAAAIPAAGWLRGPSPAAPAAAPAVSDADVALAQSQAASAQIQALSVAGAVRSARATALSDTSGLPGSASDMPVEILSLEMEPGLEALWDDSGAPNPQLTGGDRQGASLTGGDSNPAGQTDEANPTGASGQRAAGYQELSQRLGEAMAKRVMAQIERGNWEVRLLLKPAQLGEVEIELTMRSGALDAAFRTANPVTRDLLNDGLSRLREVLTGAGMDIAGLNVGGGRSQQSGGNPTPRQADGSVAAAPSGTTATPTAVSAAGPRARSTGSGWDVLV